MSAFDTVQQVVEDLGFVHDIRRAISKEHRESSTSQESSGNILLRSAKELAEESDAEESPNDTRSSGYHRAESFATHGPTVNRQVQASKLEPVLFAKKPLFRSTFRSLQSWEGVVSSIEDGGFQAEVFDQTGDTGTAEVRIPFEEVPEHDLPLVKPGAVFYWHIGYEDRKDGPRRRVSDIRFRRLPKWNQRELDQARRDAAQWLKRLE